MDYGYLVIFLGTIIYCAYSFVKKRKNIYLIIVALVWLSGMFTRKHSFYPFLTEQWKVIFKTFTMLFLIITITYLINSLRKTQIRNKK